MLVGYVTGNSKMVHLILGSKSVLLAGALMTVVVSKDASSPVFEAIAEHAYEYQKMLPTLSNIDVLELLQLPRWPCFWGEEYTGAIDVPGAKPEVVERGAGYGYRTCGLRHLGAPLSTDGAARQRPQSPCIVYSFGSNWDFDFERTVAWLHGARCEIHIFDLIEPDRAIQPDAFQGFEAKITYHKLPVNDRDGYEFIRPWAHVLPLKMRTLTLPSVMKMLGHDRLDVLKIDIEGNEHRVFSHLAEDGWPIIPGQVYMEAHVAPTAPPWSVSHVRRLIESLERVGLRLFNLERPYGVPKAYRESCFQLSFIHKDWSPLKERYLGTEGWLKNMYNVTHLEDIRIFDVYSFSEDTTAGIVRMQDRIQQHYLDPPPTVQSSTRVVMHWRMTNVGAVPLLAGCCFFKHLDDSELDVATDVPGSSASDGSSVPHRDMRPGSSLMISLPLIVPRSVGVYRSSWQLWTRVGNPVGQPFVIAISVVS
eukprot:TRINITY_DN11410_c0_g1_i1.p1 TRINITY_DN11410_c0_g1~~TRINITY_DN11410_c0_g1_i1.p1  ORF type:complete len:478 (-),score=36.87 TRINITY_DN11410_c0_g1_i1:38-1471(-)